MRLAERDRFEAVLEAGGEHDAAHDGGQQQQQRVHDPGHHGFECRPQYRAGTHLEATLELQELGQHWQMAHAADPKQQAAVLPREMMAPITRLIRD